MSVEWPQYFWCSAAHFEQKSSKFSAVSSPLSQWGHIRDRICPIKAWCEAPCWQNGGLHSVLAFLTSGGILELSWPLQHLRCQFAVLVFVCLLRTATPPTVLDLSLWCVTDAITELWDIQVCDQDRSSTICSCVCCSECSRIELRDFQVSHRDQDVCCHC